APRAPGERRTGAPSPARLRVAAHRVAPHVRALRRSTGAPSRGAAAPVGARGRTPRQLADERLGSGGPVTGARARGGGGGGALLGVSGPHPALVEVVQQVRRVLIDAVCPGALQLFLSIATRQQSHAERAGAARREQVPHAVSNHHGLVDRYPQSLGAREEQIGIGFGVLYLVAGHDRSAGGD